MKTAQVFHTKSPILLAKRILRPVSFLPLLCLLLCACPSGRKIPNDMKDFRDNQYDFKKLTKKNYHGINFDCPKVLTQSHIKDFLYKKDGMVLFNQQMGIYLSVEKFDDPDAEEYTFYYGDTISKLLSVHEYYMDQRRKSLKYYENSIKTFLPAGAKLPGALEVIYGRQNLYTDDLTYMIATVEKSNSWYVFQFIAGSELATYTFDDFEEILKSAR